MPNTIPHWLLKSLTPTLLLLAGCNAQLAGKWRLVQAAPNRETFAIDDAEFTRDGAYSLTATIEGRTRRETGEFKYNGFDLRLFPEDGGRRTFGASLEWRTLTLTDGEKRARLERVKSE